MLPTHCSSDDWQGGGGGEAMEVGGCTLADQVVVRGVDRGTHGSARRIWPSVPGILTHKPEPRFQVSRDWASAPGLTVPRCPPTRQCFHTEIPVTPSNLYFSLGGSSAPSATLAQLSPVQPAGSGDSSASTKFVGGRGRWEGAGEPFLKDLGFLWGGILGDFQSLA